ncbi:hypothetical protein Q0590_09860 [Rhodocytophaga aerolata]|uniref:DUF4157 domain-containing protein n=1 Tax=Rhodocytophaga aerolata TaxID=455078 RepID=A0ABT8R372_9BACT|nr:hypothetical protein [Rhodocytophaga aerolata]MDO1446555.1 hypothetical protein [Rhodocytophaga aerolata]
MISFEQFEALLPIACEWAEKQEEIILQYGAELNADQQIDAFLIGIKDPSKVRLLKVDHIPIPNYPALKNAVELTGLLSSTTIGVTFRYGIYIRSDCWNQRELIVHELVHTMQYERMGGFMPFLSQYLYECIQIGYPFGPLELEAKRIEMDICTK